MKPIFKTLLILLISTYCFGQEDPNILEIRKNFKVWQPLIDNEFGSCQKFYKYHWGKNYKDYDWFEDPQQNDTLSISQMSLIIKKEELGYFLYTDLYSFSGDWFVSIDYYFDAKGKLYFIFWRMNTFYAEEPVSVEKRLYFDKKGEKIRGLVSVYKMNTKEKTDISYSDMEVEYEMDISEFEEYGIWNFSKTK